MPSPQHSHNPYTCITNLVQETSNENSRGTWIEIASFPGFPHRRTRKLGGAWNWFSLTQPERRDYSCMATRNKNAIIRLPLVQQERNLQTQKILYSTAFHFSEYLFCFRWLINLFLKFFASSVKSSPVHFSPVIKQRLHKHCVNSQWTTSPCAYSVD